MVDMALQDADLISTEAVTRAKVLDRLRLGDAAFQQVAFEHLDLRGHAEGVQRERAVVVQASNVLLKTAGSVPSLLGW